MAKAIGSDYGGKSRDGSIAETFLKRYTVTLVTPVTPPVTV